MNINSFLHDPTIWKVRGGVVFGGCGLLGLAALKLQLYREKRRLQHAEQVKETYAKFPAHLLVTRRHTVRNVVVSIACTAVCATGGLYALRNYIIVSNWEDGIRKDAIGDHIGAILCYKKALRMDPTLRRTHLYIGKALLGSGHARAAIPELEEAANGEDMDPDPVAMLGDAYQILDMPLEAAQAYRRASVIAPHNPMFDVGIGGCMEKLRHPEIAYSAYLYALHANPNYVPAQLKLGSLLTNTGHLDEGMAHLRKAIEIAPNNALAHNTLATALARFKLYPEAIAEYRKSIAINSKFAVAHFNLGVTLEHMNAWERALAEFQICASLSPRNPAEKDAIERARVEVSKAKQHVKNRSDVAKS